MDPRAAAARYYDLSPEFPADIPFYLDRLPSAASRVLELGCGTGRVTLPLAKSGALLHGVDHSEAMVDICRRKLAAHGLGSDRALVSVADITALDLDTRFDCIIAPFRVMQNLASDAEVVGLFEGIRRHLADKGRAILNVFRPFADRDILVSQWSSSDETLEWEAPVAGGRVVRSVRRARVASNPLVLYPDLIYREYRGDQVVDETILSIPMRCWYPEELLSRIHSAGFEVTGRWGGYHGEAYGEGPELIVEFESRSGNGGRSG